MIKFRLLGPLELRGDGITRPIRSQSQAILLLSLLLSEGWEVSVDALINELWGGARPARTANALQAHMSRLRNLLDSLEPDRTTSRLISRSASYQLGVIGEELDGHVFLTEVSALSDGAAKLSPIEVVTRARQALNLWRGPLFGGVVGGVICRSGALRYERGRYRALEALFEAELARGNHLEIVPELSALVAMAVPPRTRFCEQLMITLYRSGRQADALDVYYRTRQRAEEIDPQALARLKACAQAILEHSPVLEHGRTDEITRRLVAGPGASERSPDARIAVGGRHEATGRKSRHRPRRPG
jgi:SARP family transcriptional regulator, regulator of embCAB operon